MRQRLTTFTLTTALLVAAVVVSVPLLWMVWRSGQIETVGLRDRAFSIRNYVNLLAMPTTGRWLANSLLLVSGQTLISCFAASLAGHVFAHHRFRFRRGFLLVLLLTLLLPGQVTLPATWRLLRELHLLDTYAALLIPSAANVLGLFLFRHACQQIPSDTIDAARIDGCSEWRIWWDVVLPMTQPTLVTFTVLSFTANWNAYLWPQIVLQDERKYTLAMGLANMASMPQARDLGIMLAATTISILPPFALFLASRDQLHESISEGAHR